MAIHGVKFTLPERELGKADAEFRVKRDGTALGRLKISNGTLVWVPKDKTYGFKLAWKDFDALMQKEGKPEAH